MKRILLWIVLMVLFCVPARAVILGNPAMTTNNQVVSYPLLFGTISNGIVVSTNAYLGTNWFWFQDNLGNLYAFTNGAFTINGSQSSGVSATSVTNTASFFAPHPFIYTTNASYTATASDFVQMFKSNYVFRADTTTSNMVLSLSNPGTGTNAFALVMILGTNTLTVTNTSGTIRSVSGSNMTYNTSVAFTGYAGKSVELLSINSTNWELEVHSRTLQEMVDLVNATTNTQVLLQETRGRTNTGTETITKIVIPSGGAIQSRNGEMDFSGSGGNVIGFSAAAGDQNANVVGGSFTANQVGTGFNDAAGAYPASTNMPTKVQVAAQMNAASNQVTLTATNMYGTAQAAAFYQSNQFVWANGFSSAVIQANNPYVPVATNLWMGSAGIWYGKDGSGNWDFVSTNDFISAHQYYSSAVGPVSPSLPTTYTVQSLGTGVGGTTYYTNTTLSPGQQSAISNLVSVYGVSLTANQTFTGTNTFNGVVTANNSGDSFAGTFNGAGTISNSVIATNAFSLINSNAFGIANTYISRAGIVNGGQKQYVYNFVNTVQFAGVLSNLLDFSLYGQGLNKSAGTNLVCLSATNSYLYPPAERSYGGIQMNQGSIQTLLPNYGSNVCVVVWYQPEIGQGSSETIFSMSTISGYSATPFEIYQFSGTVLTTWIYTGSSTFLSSSIGIGFSSFNMAAVYAGSDSNSMTIFGYDGNHINISTNISVASVQSGINETNFVIGDLWRGNGGNNQLAGTVAGWAIFNSNLTSNQLSQILKAVPVGLMEVIGDSEPITSGQLALDMSNGTNNLAFGSFQAEPFAVAGSKMVQGPNSALFQFTNSAISFATNGILNAQMKIVAADTSVNDISQTSGEALANVEADFNNLMLTIRTNAGFKVVAWTCIATSNTFVNPSFAAYNGFVRQSTNYDFLFDEDAHWKNLLGYANYYTNTVYFLGDQTHKTAAGLALVSAWLNQDVFEQLQFINGEPNDNSLTQDSLNRKGVSVTGSFSTANIGTLNVTNPPTLNGSLITNIAGIAGVTNNQIRAQTSAQTIANYTTPAGSVTNMYEIGGYVNVTAIAVDVAALQVVFTDETGTSQTKSLLSGISGTGFSQASTSTISCRPNTTITFQVALTTGTGSITYDAGGFIRVIK